MGSMDYLPDDYNPHSAAPQVAGLFGGAGPQFPYAQPRPYMSAFVNPSDTQRFLPAAPGVPGFPHPLPVPNQSIFGSPLSPASFPPLVDPTPDPLASTAGDANRADLVYFGDPSILFSAKAELTTAASFDVQVLKKEKRLNMESGLPCTVRIVAQVKSFRQGPHQTWLFVLGPDPRFLAHFRGLTDTLHELWQIAPPVHDGRLAFRPVWSVSTEPDPKILLSVDALEGRREEFTEGTAVVCDVSVYNLLVWHKVDDLPVTGSSTVHLRAQSLAKVVAQPSAI